MGREAASAAAELKNLPCLIKVCMGNKVVQRGVLVETLGVLPLSESVVEGPCIRWLKNIRVFPRISLVHGLENLKDFVLHTFVLSFANSDAYDLV